MLFVRPAQISEYDDVEKFYCELIDAIVGGEFTPEWEWGVYPCERLIKDSIEEQALYLAFLEDCLVGAMILNHDCIPDYDKGKWHIDASKDEIMFIHTLGVSKPHQGKGIAKQMLSSAIEICKEQALKTIRLDILAKNTPAEKLYSSMGFRHVASLKMFYEDTGWADFKLFELIL